MPANSPLACASCFGRAALTVSADWVATISCPRCGRRTPFGDAFREADACEAAYLRSGELRSDLGAQPAAIRFITSRMLCVLRRRGEGIAQTDENEGENAKPDSAECGPGAARRGR